MVQAFQRKLTISDKVGQAFARVLKNRDDLLADTPRLHTIIEEFWEAVEGSKFPELNILVEAFIDESERILL